MDLNTIVGIAEIVFTIAVPLTGGLIAIGIRKFNTGVKTLGVDIRSLKDVVQDLQILITKEVEKRRALESDLVEVKEDVRRLEKEQQEIRKNQFLIAKTKFEQ